MRCATGAMTLGESTSAIEAVYLLVTFSLPASQDFQDFLLFVLLLGFQDFDSRSIAHAKIQRCLGMLSLRCSLSYGQH